MNLIKKLINSEDNKNIMKYILLILVFVFAINFISSENLECYANYELNENIRLKQVCEDATYINISSVTLPNSSTTLNNIEMVSSGSGEFYVYFNQTSDFGRYDVTGISDGCTNTFATCFYIGQPLTTGIAIFYGILILFILATIVFSLIRIFVSQNIYWSVGFSVLTYFSLLMLFFTLWKVSENYLYDLSWLINLFYMGFLITLILMFPFIIGIILYVFYKIIRQKDQDSLTEMGYSPEEARRFSRR